MKINEQDIDRLKLKIANFVKVLHLYKKIACRKYELNILNTQK